jgi:hypothetical protein
MATYDVQTRIISERTLLSISRHLHSDETDAFFGDAFARLRSAAPALAPAADALEAWMREQRREPAGALRQVLIADQRTATPDTVVCDLSVPLR